jgi:hypothetical protein
MPTSNTIAAQTARGRMARSYLILTSRNFLWRLRHNTAPAFGTVPALRSGMKNAAPRPGHGLRQHLETAERGLPDIRIVIAFSSRREARNVQVVK